MMSSYQHGSPWPSLDTRLYRQSYPAGLQGFILYRHRAVLYRFAWVKEMFNGLKVHNCRR